MRPHLVVVIDEVDHALFIHLVQLVAPSSVVPRFMQGRHAGRYFQSKQFLTLASVN